MKESSRELSENRRTESVTQAKCDNNDKDKVITVSNALNHHQ